MSIATSMRSSTRSGGWRRRRRVADRRPVSRRARVILGVVGVVVLLLLWQGASSSGVINPLIGSSPIRVVKSFRDLVSNGLLWPAVLSTARLFAVGFGISIALGVVLGVFIGWYRRLDALLDPVLSVAYALPRLALIPLVVAWFGPNLTAQVVIVILMAFFPIMINVASGLSTVDEDHVRLARSFLATNRDVLFSIALPSAVPAIITGLRQGLNLALAGVVVAEYFVGATGVGGLIFTSGIALDTSEAFVGAFIFGFAALALTLLLQVVERRLGRWRVTDV